MNGGGEELGNTMSASLNVIDYEGLLTSPWSNERSAIVFQVVICEWFNGPLGRPRPIVPLSNSPQPGLVLCLGLGALSRSPREPRATCQVLRRPTRWSTQVVKRGWSGTLAFDLFSRSSSYGRRPKTTRSSNRCRQTTEFLV